MTVPQVRDAGDSMLLVEFEPVVDEAVNARVLAVAAALRERPMPGVREVRATLRSVAVDYDPLRIERREIVTALEAVLAASPRAEPGRTIEIQVVYGGEQGPDIDEVAARSGIDPRAVVHAHADREYHAFMAGFMPGFTYLGQVSEVLVAPRRATPRVRVPGGSVGIAGSLTGVYPRACPGGWALVGRTHVPMFDVEHGCLVRPGDRVRFVPVSPGDRLAEFAAPSPPLTIHGDPVATVVRPGMLTTVQDAGRWGHQRSGVPVGGALDAPARRTANAAVGNAHDAALLEATLPGLDMRVDRDCTLAVAGADLGAELDGAPMVLGAPVTAAAGAHLRLTDRRAGARAYVALAGGLAVPMVLGSRSTELGAGFGGFEGRALRAGDRLEIEKGMPAAASGCPHPHRPLVGPGGGVRLRVLLGPHEAWFTPAAIEALEGTSFLVTPNSNRVGYRLRGDVPLARALAGEMISDATVIGGVQVPPDGQPILLMADRQVTGGYPIIATVITADLALAGQVAPGDWVRFAVCTRAEALAALRDLGGTG